MSLLVLPDKYRSVVIADIEKMLSIIFSRESSIKLSQVFVVGESVSDLASVLEDYVQRNSTRGNESGKIPLSWFSLESLSELKSKEIEDFSSVFLILILPPTTITPDKWWSEEFNFKNLKNTIILSQHSASEWIMNAAQNAWFYEVGRCIAYPPNRSEPDFHLMYFTKRDYIIRHPVEGDLPALVNIEQRTWPEPIAMSEKALRDRILSNPLDHLLLQKGPDVFAVIYSQRINEINSVFRKNADTVHELRADTGPFVQLLALNILPEYFQVTLGTNLLEWMLQWRTFQKGVSAVLGVTRWKNYSDYSDLSPEEYLTYCTIDGNIIDPIPNMHQKHGAQIKSLVPNYRPKDVENKGYGVLVYYDLRSRKRLERVREIEIESENQKEKLTPDKIAEIVEQSIIQVTGQKVKERFSHELPLIDLGLESLSLMELRGVLSEKFKEDIHPTFFFQYGTAQAIIDYFVEIKLFHYKDWLYDVQWAEIPAPLESFRNFKKDRVWVIFADDAGFAEELSKKLMAYGQKYVMVKSGPYFNQKEDNYFTVRSEKEKDFDRLFNATCCQNGIEGVIYSWGLFHKISGEPSLDVLHSMHHFSCGGFLNLVRSLKKRNFFPVPRLLVASWSLQEEGIATSLAQWPLTGLCKAAAIEYPEFRFRLLSFDMEEDIKRSVDCFFLELLAHDNETQVVWRKDKRLAPRLIRLPFPTEQHQSFDSNATYLVIGAFGLGLRLLDWYSQKGAKNLVMMSHESIPDEALPILEKLKNKRIQVRLYDNINLDNFTTMRKIIDEIEINDPPIKGLIFFASIIDDDLMTRMNWNRFQPILNLKVGGSWNLHELTKNKALDHFVMFSALGSMMDPRGKANRSTANAFLDALAFYRNSRGLPALTINWAPWGNEGMVVKSVVEARLPPGLNLIRADEGLEVLNYLLPLKNPEMVVASIDWRKLLVQYPDEKPVFNLMAQEIGLKKSEILFRFKQAREEERHEILMQYVRMQLRRVLQIRSSVPINNNVSFAAIGMDPLLLSELQNQMVHDLIDELDLPSDLIGENSTVNDLAKSLHAIMHASKIASGTQSAANDLFVSNEPIAIIGMSCRFPGGVNNSEQFWNLLHGGQDAITEVPSNRWDMDAYYSPDKDVPGKMYTRFGGFIHDVDLFDPQFFGISPREAEDMDPQQRISLEVTWEALEDAGIPAHRLKGSNTGVFMGICFNDYGQLIRQSGDVAAVDNYYSTGNHYSVSAGRISYILGLEGPAMAIDTACSSSLVTIDTACEKLKLGECDMAIAGGVNLILAPESTINFCKSGMLSVDGRCKTFDASADGYVRSEGCGIVILKRLSDAQRDRNRILAVIKATAINQDGSSTGLTVPNGQAQEKLIRLALKKANLKSSEISYVEAHGTGTALGDPIEVKAILATYGENRAHENPLILGSVKTNIGHTEAAAGVAGLIKCVLALQHQEIPKHLHFQKLNPYINLDANQILIPAENRPWKSEGPRYAAISSFGFSGTNSHAILEEAPVDESTPTILGPYIFVLSAKEEMALLDSIDRLRLFLQANPTVSLANVAYTLQVGREHFAYRISFTSQTISDLIHQLEKVQGLKFVKIENPIEHYPTIQEAASHWLNGKTVDWDAYYKDQKPKRISLPTYPFRRERYWATAVVEGKNMALAQEKIYASEDALSPNPQRTSLWDLLLVASQEQYLKIIENYVHECLINTLQLSHIPPDFHQQDLVSFGMDSIMGIQFRNQLDKSLQGYLSLPSTLVFDFPSVKKISAMILDNVIPLIQSDTHEKVSLAIESIAESGKTHFKLSSSQSRMWFMYELNRNDVSANIFVYSRIRGKFELALIQDAFDRVIERHAILRTTYQYVENEIAQLIHPAFSIPIQETDWRGFSEAEQLEKLTHLEENLEPFDLEKGPVVRPKVMWLKDEEAIFYIEVHHIACDGASFQTLFSDWLLYYEALRSETQPDLSPLKYEYVDYANWLYREHDTQAYQLALDYWKKQLETAPRLIQLPTDYPRQMIDAYKGAQYQFDISPALKEKIEKFAKSHETTPFAVLLSVYALILHKYSRDEEINIGIPFSRRPISETENMVGFFINTLVTRHNLGEDSAFSVLLKHTSQMVRDAFVHQAASFEEVVDALNIPRNLSVHPLFQAHFNLIPGFFKHWKKESLDVEMIGVNSGYPEFDLALEMFETETRYYSAIKYNEKIFRKETVSRIATHFTTLLEEVLDNPSLKNSEISLLGASERSLVLESWNNTHRDYPLQKRVIDFFEEQVEKNPSAKAAIYEDDSLTYQELNERANRLAHRLLKRNIKPDEFVGICLPRSLDMVVALLAIMKSGAAYIPFDSTFPSHRLCYMIENSSLNSLITIESLIELFPDYSGDLICLDREKSELALEPSSNPEKRSSSENLAYVIYTSGSTGNPKGVQIEQRSLTNVLLSIQEQLEFKASDVMLALTTLSFDIATAELCLPLITGASVVIAPEEAKRNVWALQELIKKHHVTMMQATPTTWMMLFESGWPGHKDLTAWTAGEPLKSDLANQLVDSCKALWNLYGPTEITIYSSCTKIERDESTISIGKPVANASYYILDSHFHPTPIGVPGQLWVGGVGVARGYVKLPDLNRDKFIPDPFRDESNARMYNSGDLARYLPDGRVECLGRADYQVKIRGYRIELGDIEAQLNEIPQVRDAVVIVREDLGITGKSDKRLVAYIIPEEKEEALFKDVNKQRTFFNEIKSVLKKQLPEYMIPAAFVLMDAFPLTLNHKIDRKILPRPETVEHEISGDIVQPTDAIESDIAEVWRAIIGLTRVSMDDNFFDAGGNSLLALRVFNGINALYPEKLTLIDLFAYPTIAQLSAQLREKLGIQKEPILNTQETHLAPEVTLEDIQKMTDQDIDRFLDEEE